MAAEKSRSDARCASSRLAPLCLLLAALTLFASPVAAQTEVSHGQRLTDDMRSRLTTPGDLTLRDATFVEAMLAIRKVWGVNIVVGNDLKEETVSCEFVDTELHEILDTLLTPRGLAYRPIGKSLVIVKQETLGAMKPLFETATVPVLSADPKEVKEAVSFYLSEKGQIQVVESAKRLVVIDYPDRIEHIISRVRELDEAAQGLGHSSLSAAERMALDRGAGNAGNAAAPPNALGPLNPLGPAGQGVPSAAGTSLAGSGFPGSGNKAAFFDLKHVKAELVMPTLQPLLSPTGKISALPRDNRLIAVDVPERLALIAQAVRELDVPRPQVRIAALIYDASLEDVRRLGINWVGTGFHGHNLTSTGAAQDSAVLSAITSATPAATAANGMVALQSLGSTFDVTAVVQALAQSKKSRLLADPTVTVYDQEQAKIDIVTEIPFQQLTQGANGSNIGTTAFREAGVSLMVTPQIAADETITMLVNPRFSLLTGFTPGTNQPIIDRRETNTTVRVRNRETLVIGGLRQKNSINGRTGIPFLMDLHWPIGDLFKTKDTTAKDSELVVFITPEVIDLCYLGQTREHDIHGAAMPALDTIPAPEIPLPPCPLEPWKLRCGCKHCKKGGHDGPCTACRDVPATQVYEQPPVHQESLPPTRPQVVNEPPAAGGDAWVPSSPLMPEQPAPERLLPERTMPERAMPERALPERRLPEQAPPPAINTPANPRGQETSVPPLSPVQIESAQRRVAPQFPVVKRLPAVGMPASEQVAQVKRLPGVTPMKRLPAIGPADMSGDETPAAEVANLPKRDQFKSLPPVEGTKWR